MTGTLGGPDHKLPVTNYHARHETTAYPNPDELGQDAIDIVESSAAPFFYSHISSTQGSRVPSAGWSYVSVEVNDTNKYFECSYCFYDHLQTCKVPTSQWHLVP